MGLIKGSVEEGNNIFGAVNYKIIIIENKLNNQKY